jgi:glycosyltransferase involved in cell wall biosynthesis
MITMEVAIFTGSINLQKGSTDVRKLYILEKLKYFSFFDIKLKIITPCVNECTLSPFKNIQYDTYKFIDRKHFKLLSSSIYSMNKLIKLDCKLLHCYNLQAAVLAWLINIFREDKYLIIFEPMGLAYEESKHKNPPLKDRLAGSFAKFPEKLIFKKSDAVILYTHSLKKYVSQKFSVDAEKIYIIPHGTNLNVDHTIEKLDKLSICNKLNISEKNKIVMYGGSLSDLHGTPYLIEAINYVSKKRQDISFLILGRGELEKTLKNYIVKNRLTNVYLLGFVSSEEFAFYLNSADILLIPHAKCTQTELDPPTKLFEYLASGKPIVSFNLKAIAEVVGDNAVLVEPDNPRALADGILTLVDNERLCKRLGIKGKLIAEKYSSEVSAKKQYELYTQLYKKISRKPK